MSSINGKKKIVHIHIPKTGGTSLEATGLFGTPIIRHHTLQFYIDLYQYDDRINLDDYFKFAFVRNPYDKFASGVLNHILDRGALEPVKDKRKQFNDFILENNDKFGLWIMTHPQYKFVEVNGKVGVDFIGKMENMAEDWRKICDIIGVKVNVGHKNKSGRKYDSIYTPETKAIVREYYKRDFELFNYPI